MFSVLYRKDILTVRYRLLLVAFFVLGAIMSGRLFYLQILKGEHYEAKARRQHRINQVLLQHRGEIFMHSGRGNLAPLAVNKQLNLLYAVPREIDNAQKIAKELADILFDVQGECGQLLPKEASRELVEKCVFRKEKEEEFYYKLNKANDPYELLAHQINEKDKKKIEALGIKGIYFEDEWVRYYPEEEAAGQLTGFLGFRGDKRAGQYGIEGYFDEELAGESGRILGDKDISGRLIAVGETELKEAKDGEDIVLTLDKIIQDKAYEIIKQAVEDYGAEHGTMIVMDPQSGAIKAMVGYPSYNPNKYNEVEDLKIYENLNVSEAYEPGSIFKVITMAAGLDSGAVKADERYVDEGFVKFGKHIIRNADNEKYGEISMTEVLENSVNTGAIHVALKVGKDKFRTYVKKFGFGKKTQVGLSGEVAGDISTLDKRGDIYLATASYGQGITVTPLQMAAAMSTIVNDGRLVKPFLVEKLGDKIVSDQTGAGVRVISAKTARVLKAMLVSVVKNGHGKKAQVAGYYLGGKTGTAEIADERGGYSDQNNHSFIGFGPLEDSKFVIMVKLSKPKWGRFSAVTAAPTFQKMAKFLLQYYKIPPSY